MGWSEIKLLFLDWRIQILIWFILLAVIVAAVLTYMEFNIKRKREVIDYREKKRAFFSKFKYQVKSAEGIRGKIDVIDRVAKAYFRDVFQMNTKKDYLSLITDFKLRGQNEIANFCRIMFECYYSSKDVSEKDIENIMGVLIDIITSIDEFAIQAQNKEFYEKAKQMQDNSENVVVEEEVHLTDESIDENLKRFFPTLSSINKYKPVGVKLDSEAKSLLEDVDKANTGKEELVREEEPTILLPTEVNDGEGDEDKEEDSGKEGRSIIERLVAVKNSILNRRNRNRELKMVFKREKELKKKLSHQEKERHKLEALELEKSRKKEIESLKRKEIKEKEEKEHLQLSLAKKRIKEVEKAYLSSKEISTPDRNVGTLGKIISRSKDVVVSLKNLREYSLTIQKEKELDKKEMEAWANYGFEQLTGLRESLRSDVIGIGDFIKKSKDSQIYSCVNCGIEVSERDAMAKNFKCAKCGQFYAPIESRVFLIDSRRKLLRLKKALNFVETRIADLNGEEEKKKLLNGRREKNEKEFEKQSEELDLERQEWLKSLESKRSGMRESNTAK